MAKREKRVPRRTAILTVLTVAAFTTCAGAQANTVQVGNSLTGKNFTRLPFAGERCTYTAPAGLCFWVYSPVTMVRAPTPEPGGNGEPPATSPVDGTVISYRLAEPDGTFAIQVIRGVTLGVDYLPPSEVRGQSISTSAPTPISFPGVSPPVATNLAIQKGDSVGIRNFSVGNATDGFSDLIGLGCCYLTLAWYPPLADGAPQQDIPDPGFGLGLQATVRYCQVPKLKGKSRKAARKALRAADCTVGKLTKTKKVRDKKEVVSQSVKPGKAVSDTKPIKLGLSRKQG